jgi:uncharacterized membrane protein YvbJ
MPMKNNYIFCNNCGKSGHLFQQCKQPITSIGKNPISYYDLINNFNDYYKPKQVANQSLLRWKEKIIYIVLIMMFIGIIA